MGAAAGVIMAKERHLVRHFEEAGVTSPERARTPDEMGIEPSGLAWHRLRDRAVLREAPPESGRYYVDVEVWQASRRVRQRIALVLGIMFLLAALLLMLSRR